MKTKKTFLVLCLSFFFLFCSKDIINESFGYTVYVSDNCDCAYDDYVCVKTYPVSKAEYNKLLGILNDSTESCNYIYSKEYKTGIDFEGYLIKLDKYSYGDIFVY